MMHGQKNIKCFPCHRADESVVRVPKMVHGNISLARSIYSATAWFVFTLPDQRLCIVNTMCIYTHIRLRTDCIWITVVTKQHCSETFLHKSERCEVLTGYLSLGRRSGCDWASTWHWKESFTVCFWSKKQQPQLLPGFVLIAFLEETRGELSYLAPLGSENISAPYFKQCFFRGGGCIAPPDWVKHHASQSQDRNNKYFILYIEFCINNKI